MFAERRVFAERRRLTQSYLSALQELASYHLANQAPKEALANIEKALPLDILNEDLYCLAMRAYAGVNDLANVARIYSKLVDFLLVELNTTPMRETTSLYQELRNRSR